MSMTSFIPSTVSLWNNLDLNVRNSPNILWYYGERLKKLSILHARLRHQCSSLNSDLYRINITNDPKCQCGAPFEDSINYLMECPLYQNERNCLFRNLRETHKNIETLLFGNGEININENSIIFNKVRAYIRQIKRFYSVVGHLAYININLFPMFHYIVLNIIYIYVCARFFDIIICVLLVGSRFAFFWYRCGNSIFFWYHYSRLAFSWYRCGTSVFF
jgi:hypothetical protein